jgi:hypothetical protein
MITFLLIIGLVISLGLNVASFILIRIHLLKIRTYELWIVGFKSDLMNTLERMRTIDKVGTFATSLNDKGLFESDDQVGQIFKELLDLIEKLNQRTQ